MLPLVNKGLCLYQWRQDVDAAVRLCNEALNIDPECEAALATLAQLNLQIGNIAKAVEMFGRHADIARNEPELINALTYKYVRIPRRSIWLAANLDLISVQASQAQIEFVADHPDMAGQLNSMARAL